MHTAIILIASTEVHVIKEALSVSSDMVSTNPQEALPTLLFDRLEIDRIVSLDDRGKVQRERLGKSKRMLSTEEATTLSYMDGWELKVLWNDK